MKRKFVCLEHEKRRRRRIDSFRCLRADLLECPDDNKGVKKDRSQGECSFFGFRSLVFFLLLLLILFDSHTTGKNALRHGSFS